MIRAIIESLLLFLLPFAGYALYLFARQKPALDPDHWSKPFLSLVITGLVIVSLSFVASALMGERHPGGYVPAHLENGKLVPGTFQ